jgi:hypothetical protein
MKKTAIVMMVAAMVAGTARAADVSATADFASAYIFRGVTLNDGLVFQPGVSVAGLPIPEQYGAVTFGTWANYDIAENPATLRQHEFSEVDYYLTYVLPVKAVDISATYTEYTYPTVAAEADREVALAVGKAIGETGLYPSLTVNYGLDGLIDQDWYIQCGLGYSKDLTEALSLSASVKAAYVIDDGGADGFNDATASLGLAYALTENWSIKGSVNYVAQLDDEVLTDVEYDKPLYGTLGLACNF